MSTGVKVDAACEKEWNSMKLKHMYNFLTFKIENDSVIVVADKGSKNGPYSGFLSALPANECRYGVVEVPGTTKIVFVLWAPDSAPVKGKMVYAASRQAIIEKLSGHTRTLQASSMSDLEEKKVKSQV